MHWDNYFQGPTTSFPKAPYNSNPILKYNGEIRTPWTKLILSCIKIRTQYHVPPKDKNIAEEVETDTIIQSLLYSKNKLLPPPKICLFKAEH